jgi:hypothetical protein
MTEFGKSIPVEEQHEINVVLNEAEELIDSEESQEIQQCLARVETVANQLTESLMTAV